MGACLLSDSFEVRLHVGDAENGKEELGIGIACEDGWLVP